MTAGPTFIDVLPVPDRVDNGLLRLCLQLTPTQEPGPNGPVDLSDWPGQVLEHAASVGVWIAEIENGEPIRPRWVGAFAPDLAEILTAPSAVPGGRIVDRATAKWCKMFPDGRLPSAVTSASDPGTASLLQGSAFDAVAAAPTAALDRFLEGTYREALQKSVELRLVGPGALLDPGSADRSQAGVHPWAAIAERMDVSRTGRAGPMAETDQAEDGVPFPPETAEADEDPRAAIEAACRELCAKLAAMPSSLDALLTADLDGAEQAAFDWAMLQTFRAVGSEEQPDPMDPPPPETEPDADEKALRKLSALLSYPTLAKYLGLCADILIPPDTLEAMGAGLIAVELRRAGESFPSQPDIGGLAWTAFACRRSRPGALYFGPWEGPSPTSFQACSDGLLDLGHHIGTQPRFQLGSEAALHTYFRVGEKAASVTRRTGVGRTRLDDPKPLPDRTTKGIVLYDRLASIQHAARLHEETKGTVGNVNYVDGLTAGLRFDVLLEPRSRGKVAEWRPLMARHVTYSTAGADPKTGIDANFLKHEKVLALAYRDDAVAVGPIAENASSLAVLQELMQWGGGSLAVSTSQDEIVSSGHDIDVGVNFGLPDVARSRKLCPPPLRYGRDYRVRARLALPLGCGLTFADIEAAGGFDSQVLPPIRSADGARAPGYPFRRFEAVGAPPVVLPWDSRLVTDPDPPAAVATQVPAPALAPGERRPSPPRSPTPLAGRALEELVVRSTDRATADVRFLLPARLALSEAEHQGQFDDGRDDDQRAPQGAFEKDLKVALYGPEGRLPEARAGTVTWFDPEAEQFAADPPGTLSSGEIGAAQSRGAVLVVNPRAMRRQRERYDADKSRGPQPRYYPDRFSRRAVASLLTASGYSPVAGSRKLAFWGRNAAPRDALPAMIELKAGPTHATPARFTGRPTVDIRPPQGGGAVSLPRLTVTLAPAEVVDLEIFADCDEPGFAEMHHGRCAVQEFVRERGSPDAAIRSISVSPLEQVVFSRKLRLVHAVDRPIRPPAIIELKAVTLTVRPEASETRDRRSWADHVACGLASLRSEEGGASTFFVGAMSADSRSTGQLRLEARWRGYGPETIKRNPVNGTWIEDLADEFAELFRIDLSPDESDVDLLRESGGVTPKLRALSHAFKDGRARGLRLRPVGTSRFTAYFPPDRDPPALERIGRYERAANEFANEPDLWVDCTFRPPPPTVDRTLPVFLWDYERKSPNLFLFSRNSVMRLFLQPDWYASGEGERLGVVFDAEDRPVCDYSEEPGLGPFARFLTRWGRDAIRNTPAVTSLRPRNIIRAGAASPAVAGKLYPGASDSSIAETLKPLDVLVVPLEPVLDPELGLYCDIEIGTPGAATTDFLPSYMPFIQLGLVRYQPHAVDGLQLSRPVEYTAQILPHRSGEVRVIGRSRVRVTVRGQAYGYAKPELGPRLDIRLLVRQELPVLGPFPSRDYAWFPATKGETEVVNLDVAPKEDAGAILWEVDIDLPASRQGNHYGILIEEYEWLFADPDNLAGLDPAAGAHAGTVRTRRGPVFATTVDIR